MQQPYQSPVGIFDRRIPSAFVADSIRCLKDCYKRAYDHCRSHYPSQVAHDLRPILRRAEFEKEWRLVAERFTGMESSYEQNAAKNCYHTRIVCGQVVMTASYTDRWVGSVRSAEFRNAYAQRNEAFLFPELAPAPLPDAPLYAILQHDATPKQPDRPNFADIIFPDSQGRIVGRIKLAERFPNLFAEEPVPAETVSEEPLDIEIYADVQKRKSV